MSRVKVNSLKFFFKDIQLAITSKSQNCILNSVDCCGKLYGNPLNMSDAYSRLKTRVKNYNKLVEYVARSALAQFDRICLMAFSLMKVLVTKDSFQPDMKVGTFYFIICGFRSKTTNTQCIYERRTYARFYVLQ